MIVATATAGWAAQSRTVSGDRWIRGICAAWVDYLDTVDAALAVQPERTETVQEISTSTGAARDRREAMRLQADVVEAGAAVADAVRVGSPDIAGGKALQARYLATVADYRQTDTTLLRDIRRLPTVSAARYEAGLADAFQQSWEAWAVIGQNPLDDLRAVPELAPMIDGSSQCQAVDAWFDLGFASDVEIGECWDDEQDTISCDAPHMGELFLRIDHPAARGEPYPGSTVVNDYAISKCEPAFGDYVGRDYQSSEFDFVYLTPDESTWRSNDREIFCLVTSIDESPLVGRVRGTGR